jgi:NCAIR mutase (PurE)-related protein
VRGPLRPAEAARRIGELPYAEIAHAVGASMIDHHRELRTGVPEIVYGASKTPDQIAVALRELTRVAGGAIATRVDAHKAAAVSALLPGVTFHGCTHRHARRAIRAARREADRGRVCRHE